MARRYDMSAREEARRRTREVILDAAVDLFTASPYEEVTLGDVAAAAGVSTQTVLNHFENKPGLYLAGVTERVGPEVERLRGGAVPGDVGSVVAAVLRDYETTGDGTFRTIELVERLPELRPVLRLGDEHHRGWVAEVLGPRLGPLSGGERERALALSVVVLDVRTWQHLRRVQGVDVDTCQDYLCRLLEAVLVT